MAAAARGSGRASAPGLFLLLLVPLLWAPAGVRAVPDEALSHRNGTQLAQQLRKRSPRLCRARAGPGRGERDGPGRARLRSWRRRVPGSPLPERRPRLRLPARGGTSAPASRGGRRELSAPFPVTLASPGSYGEESKKLWEATVNL